MGRIRTALIKRSGQNILKKYPDKFQSSFDHNKKALDEVADIYSNKLRNVIAGYITHLLREEKK